MVGQKVEPELQGLQELLGQPGLNREQREKRVNKEINELMEN